MAPGPTTSWQTDGVMAPGPTTSWQTDGVMAPGPTTSWQTDGETVEAVTDFTFLGSKITAD